ncbi:MAG: hypothetical protein Athens071426_378 [Parcubacteria group bacterium Athens0714_26]|nr:MAG: hypothetical protein Athens101426_528 [Parcubacteria group bacterium Athens1014_26]TSD02866.1 MAG: hypothetical protein Athens071426_378 [Parcubacteria group bacterium Athens0714_26]
MLISSLQNLWIQVINWIPSLIGALVVFIIGLIVAAGLASLVERVIAMLKLDALLRKFGLEEYAKRANLSINSGRFLGQLVYWFMVIAFLLAASDILGFFALSTFLRDVLVYLPNIIVAVLIMVVALVAANVVGRLIRVSVAGAKLHFAKFLGSAARWVIIIFGLLAALTQLGIATSIINTLITGIIAMIAIAGGLAFGLGGRDYATHLLQIVRDELEGNR